MIWIIGGTSEGEYLSKTLENIPHIITLGTEEGMKYYHRENYQYKRMSKEDMADFINDERIDLVIDLTHPFAVNVSRNAREVCQELEIPYKRYERPSIKGFEHTRAFESYDECFEYLDKNFKGTLFVTTGVNHVEYYEEVRNDNRFIYRVLPMIESVSKLVNLGVHIKDIVAMVGPFNEDIEKEFYKFYKADAVVMKDSGQRGGTLEKLKAAEELGLETFLIRREEAQDQSFVDFVSEIKDLIANKK